MVYVYQELSKMLYVGARLDHTYPGYQDSQTVSVNWGTAKIPQSPLCVEDLLYTTLN